MFAHLRAVIGYRVARLLFRVHAAVAQPRVWQWMQGQYARKANHGDPRAQSFYGHILLFRGQGPWARQEGIRLLTLAATAGEPKAAYQMGILCLKGEHCPPDPIKARDWLQQAAAAGHPAALSRLQRLDGGEAN